VMIVDMMATIAQFRDSASNADQATRSTRYSHSPTCYPCRPRRRHFD
jgi:hypothetical protein